MDFELVQCIVRWVGLSKLDWRSGRQVSNMVIVSLLLTDPKLASLALFLIIQNKKFVMGWPDC